MSYLNRSQKVLNFCTRFQQKYKNLYLYNFNALHLLVIIPVNLTLWDNDISLKTGHLIIVNLEPILKPIFSYISERPKQAPLANTVFYKSFVPIGVYLPVLNLAHFSSLPGYTLVNNFVKLCHKDTLSLFDTLLKNNPIKSHTYHTNHHHNTSIP